MMKLALEHRNVRPQNGLEAFKRVLLWIRAHSALERLTGALRRFEVAETSLIGAIFLNQG